VTKSGRYIVLEGIDGCGKTTTARALSETLHRAVLLDRKGTRDPDPWVAHFFSGVGASLWGAEPTSPVHLIPEHTWLHLHAAWCWLVHERRIAPLLAQGVDVVADAWWSKPLARNAVHELGDHEAATQLFAHVPAPDVTLFLDVEPVVASARRTTWKESELGAHGGLFHGTPQERFITYQGRVRKALQRMAQQHGWATVRPQVTDSPEVVLKMVARVIESNQP
jgi:dTMP kinase